MKKDDIEMDYKKGRLEGQMYASLSPCAVDISVFESVTPKSQWSNLTVAQRLLSIEMDNNWCLRLD